MNGSGTSHWVSRWQLHPAWGVMFLVGAIGLDTHPQPSRSLPVLSTERIPSLIPVYNLGPRGGAINTAHADALTGSGRSSNR